MGENERANQAKLMAELSAYKTYFDDHSAAHQRSDALSANERKRERWCRYAAGAVSVEVTPANAAKWADELIAMEEKRFGKVGET